MGAQAPREAASPREVRAAVILFLALAAAFVILSLAPGARAQTQGDAGEVAKALQKKAMEEDYLSTEFTKAADKLEKAIAQCGADQCSAGLRARLRRDLGVVQIGGAIDREKGIGNFAEALKLDPAVALEPDIKTKDLEAAFAEAKKRVAGGGATPGATAQPQSSDFVHTPAAEQTVRTPIPVYVEYTGSEALAKVVVRYKGFGMTDWKTVELARTGARGFGGLLPCGDVQTGTTQYFIQGVNANNDPVAAAGDRNTPYRVPVRAQAVAEPPRLPNTAPPAQCQDTRVEDCPPGFPGCKKEPEAQASESTAKDAGEYCEEDFECKSNQCSNAKCTEPAPKKRRRFWVGVAGLFDVTFVPTAEDACKLHPRDANDTNNVPTPINDNNYYCVREGGVDYPSRTDRTENDAIVASKDQGSDKVAGGGAFGNVRVLLSFDYAATGNLLVGARAGIVLNNYPGNEAGVDGKRFAAPIHLEARITYVFGNNDPIFRRGFAPYLNAGLGLAHFETKVPVEVIETRAGQNAEKRKVDAWQLAGPAFLMFGGGFRITILPQFALSVGARANFAFVNAFAASLVPELGLQVGF